MKYLAILRGINVSGQKSVKMDDLRNLFEGLGFCKVSTFIQSGNVLFQSSLNNAVDLVSKIEDAINTSYGFRVPVLVISIEELDRTISGNPFSKMLEIDLSKLHVTFLSEVPDQRLIDGINPDNFLPDRFFISGKAVYLFCPLGYGTTKLSNTFFENKLKVTATTRNWNTVLKLSELAK